MLQADQKRRAGRQLLAMGCGLLALFFMGAQSDRSDSETKPAETPRRGLVIPVPVPLPEAEGERIVALLKRAEDDLRKGSGRPVVVLKFVADDDGRGTKFGVAYEFASILASERFAEFQTVAYIPDVVLGHAVLAVMACEQIVMHAEAEFGAAGIDESKVRETHRAAYDELASERGTIPSALARGMLEHQIGVTRVELVDGGTRYVFDDQVEKWRAKATLLEQIIPAGELGRFSGREMRLKLGMVSHVVVGPTELAQALGIELVAPEAAPPGGSQWQALRIRVSGHLHAQKVTDLLLSCRDQIPALGANLLCFEIDSAGGDPRAALRLASEIAQFDSREVRTVAFVRGQARSVASLIALACDEVIMSPESSLGGVGGSYLDAADMEDLGVSIRRLAKRKQQGWSLMLALVNPNVRVHQYTLVGRGVQRILSEEEWHEQKTPERWQKGEEVVVGEGLEPELARTCGVSTGTAVDFGDVKRKFNLQGEVAEIKRSWINASLERLALQPWFGRTLLFIAFFMLVSEFSAPGLGVAGFVSGLCFLLFFWSQFLSGSATWLEVLLFAGGVVCIGLEIFVIPGFGIFGAGGGLLVIGAIVLASQTFVIPRNAYQFDQLPRSLLLAISSVGGVLVAGFLMRRFLTELPLLRRFMLDPPEQQELQELREREALVHWEYLLGKRGKTKTPLSPAGKVQFGDAIVDVISAGERIATGTDVKVTEVQGNRIVVVRLDEEIVV